MQKTHLKIILSALIAVHSGKTNLRAQKIEKNLRSHIEFLASDKLEGRRTGTQGEELAMQYITDQFKKAGLQPKGNKDFQQAFEVSDGKMMSESVAFSINGNKIEKDKNFFVFPFSANMEVVADIPLVNPEGGGSQIIDLKATLEENKNNPHFDLPEYIHKKAKEVIAGGANAVIFYNSSDIDDKLVFDGKNKSEGLNGVSVYLKKVEAEKYFGADAGMVHVELTSVLKEKKRTGYNVIGYIDNKAATTVVLGAHYDHLGYGEDGNSREAGHEKGIHNGADDNASGTAALIELASLLKRAKAKNNNYLFIAFSGEELGLYGSKYFVENPTIDLKTVNYMINMDMVGRLNDSTKVLTIGGYGTSPGWPIFSPKEKRMQGDNIIMPRLVIKLDSSGIGPSDHTSFYRKDIPVLFFFTGLHTDYHKPTDDADKINYRGTEIIIGHIVELIHLLDDDGKLAFTKTREAQTTTSARFSVSMGIMPDYTFSGTGVRADGVSEGKPAMKAGLKTGDIIIQIGDYNTNSLENYMQALGKFKKGEKTKVKFKRGNETLEAEVEF
ncbi:MAG: M20/M25/M40 family metallo-hydrolase [Chitinophagaceae bacterium]|nr:M20/M25/M40 family metallo-hydrolase [Chitinophagaceae bacterium]